MSDPRDRRDRLTPEQRRRLDERLESARRRLGQETRPVSIPRRDWAGQVTGQPPPVPLSYAQERLWYLYQLAPENPLYNRSLALRLRGRLDIPALEFALGRIMQRHTTLNSAFPARDGEPVCIIHPVEPVSLGEPRPVEAHPEESLWMAAGRVLREEAHRPFVLENGPVVRFSLHRLAEDDHLLLAVVHHIVFDAWSAALFTRELAAFYASVELTEPPVQYADYAAWQKGMLGEQAMRPLLESWLERLEGAPLDLDLPADRPRPAVQAEAGERYAFLLPAELSAGVRCLAEETGSTPFMVLLAAFAALIYRYTGRDEFVLGTPVAGRSHLELEELLGFFVNMLPLRCNLAGDGPLTFLALLKRVREMAQHAFANASLPFERLVEALHLSSDLSRPPVFNVVFNLKNLPTPAAALPSVSKASLETLYIEPFDFDDEIAPYDLTFEIVPAGGPGRADLPMECRLIYATALFDRWRIAGLSRHYLALLKEAVRAPETLLDHLPLMDPAEQAQTLAWGAPSAPAAGFRPAHIQVAEQAGLTPHAPAVVQGGRGSPRRQVSYRELDVRANRIAHRLLEDGVGPENVVAVFLPRSVDEVAALLGVMKAGAAYLPLDPAYPDDRLRAMLRDACPELALTQRPLASRLDGLELRCICLDEEAGRLAVLPDIAPPADILPRQAAYISYTSGSAGVPKGVVVEHAGLSNLIGWHIRAFDVTAADRATHLAGLSFDASVWELWPHLAAGAQVHLLEEEADLHLDRLTGWLAQAGITICYLPTQLAEDVLHEPWPADTRLRYLLTGGDRLKRYPPPGLPFRLVNNYGPTECTVVTTSGAVHPEDAEGKPDCSGLPHEVTYFGAPSIGFPIDGVVLHVVDRLGQPLPAGIAGELCIGGAGVARGYLGRPALTALRFRPDLFPADPGKRMYCSGDRVRWLPDGRLEYLGRPDDQVRLRGQRIELGEIEAALCRMPDVRAASVVLRREAGGPRLAAFVVPEGEWALEPGQSLGPARYTALLKRLRESLWLQFPDEMLPDDYVFLDALPLTVNGKVDRFALLRRPLEPVSTGPTSAATEQPARLTPDPANPLLETLREIWAEVLGVEQVALNDHFVDLGGHSLLAIRLLARVESRLGRTLSLRSFLEDPTVAGMAAALGGSAAPAPAAPQQNLSGHPARQAMRRAEPVHSAYGLPPPSAVEENSSPKTLHARFARIAANMAQAVAVSQGRDTDLEPGVLLGRVTYRQLNARANRLANDLIRLGVHPGDRVGLFMERTPDLVVGVLGILKAGAVYLPLDPQLPDARLVYMMEDSRAAALVTQAALFHRLEGLQIPSVVLDGGRQGPESSLADQSLPDPPERVGLNSPAYVIYTSGSTGEPKGVLVSHANVLSLIESGGLFGFGSDDVWSMFHSIAFDFSVWEMWGALLTGGRLVMVPYYTSRTPSAFAQLLDEEGVTVLNQTPSAFLALLGVPEMLDPDFAPALRLVIFGGEALSPAGLRSWFERRGDRYPSLVNMYGITETTVHVTHRRLHRADVDQSGSPIGEGIPGWKVYLLGQDGRPVPDGAEGEIYVGGAGVSLGYLNRPALTAERFIPDPFSGTPGARLYRSGDLARRLPDGGLEYLGRTDSQVKLRGFRIELGEIQAALLAQPGVVQAVVLLHQDALQGDQLVGFVVPAAGTPADDDRLSGLRQQISDTLPAYMVPAKIVPVEAIPLTANGKVDRQALLDRLEPRPPFNG